MNTNKTRLAIFCIASTLILAFSSAPPAGRTGAPGDGLCTDCHSNSAGFGGGISISGVPSNPIPNTTYSVNVTVSVSAGSPVRGGFQLVALDNANDEQAGTWSNTDSASSISMSGSRQYWGHSPAQAFGGGSISFDADWTAPNISDNVTFYAASILGNGSGSTGDNMITTVETVTIVGSTPLELEVGSTPTTCNGDMDGTAEVVVSGGTPPYNYNWNNGSTGSVANGLEAGVYIVIVTDDLGEVAEIDVEVMEPDVIQVDPAIMGIICSGDSNADVDLNPLGGTGSLSCDWGFGNDCFQGDLSAGTYAVTVSDIVGCEIVTMITIDDVDPIMANLSVDDATMGNDGSITAMPSGGIGNYDFVWSTGFIESNVTQSTISDLSPDAYMVTITDSNGCMTESTVSVMGSNCTLSVQPFFNNIECAGDSSGAIQLVVDGVSGTPTYMWSDSSTNPILINVSAGAYSVTVSDGPDCMQILDSLVITEPDTLMATTLVKVNASCSNINNGRITLGINGGVGNYDLMWSHGPTNDTLMDGTINIPDTLIELSVGTYAYTLTDGNFCSIMDSIVIGNGDILAPFVMVQETMILLDSFGMAPSVDFSQIDMGSFDNCGVVDTVFSAGPYTCADIGIYTVPVSLIDGNGNETTEMVTIVVAEEIAPEIECSQSSVVTNSCEPVFYSVPLATDNCDVPLVEIVSGLPSGSVFSPGVNSVTYRATDNCNNSAECTFTITVNSDLSAEAITTPASCGDNDGTLMLNVTGGTPPYDIVPFGEGTGLAPGNYPITVTDSLGCVTEITAVVEMAANDIMLQIETTDVSCFGGNDGSAIFTPTGGSGTYTISLDPQNLSAGTYTVDVTDDSGCMATESFVIGEPEPITSEIIFDFDPCTNIPNFQIGELSGGTGLIEVVPEVISGDTIVVNLTIFDANGCTITESFMIPSVELLSLVDVAVIEDNNGNEEGGATVTLEGGTSPFMYEWTDVTGMVVSTELNLSGVGVGEYMLVVIDANGCSVSASIEVMETSATIDLDSTSYIADVYPNPAQNILTVEFQNTIADRISIFDINGKQLLQQLNLSQLEYVDLSDIEAGLYIIQLEYKDNLYVKRFIKI